MAASEQVPNINPYATYPGFVGGSNFQLAYNNGLTTIASAISPSPTLGQLNSAIVVYIQSMFYPTSTPDQLYKLNAMVGSLYNAFIQPGHAFRAYFSPAQLNLIEQIMSQIDSMNINLLSGTNVFFLQEEAIEDSNLTAQEQAPLYMAMAIVEEAWNFFYGLFSAALTTPWSAILDNNNNINYMNIRNLMNGIFAGALIGYTQSKALVPTNAEDGAGVGENFITAIAGALTMTFGISVFQWAWKPMAVGGFIGDSCNCNR